MRRYRSVRLPADAGRSSPGRPPMRFPSPSAHPARRVYFPERGPQGRLQQALASGRETCRPGATPGRSAAPPPISAPHCPTADESVVVMGSFGRGRLRLATRWQSRPTRWAERKTRTLSSEPAMPSVRPRPPGAEAPSARGRGGRASAPEDARARRATRHPLRWSEDHPRRRSGQAFASGGVPEDVARCSRHTGTSDADLPGLDRRSRDRERPVAFSRRIGPPSAGSIEVVFTEPGALIRAHPVAPSAARA
jgi:hypothetical protein